MWSAGGGDPDGGCGERLSGHRPAEASTTEREHPPSDPTTSYPPAEPGGAGGLVSGLAVAEVTVTAVVADDATSSGSPP